MDDDVRVEPEVSKIAVPRVAGEPLVGFLTAEDSALANTVRRVVTANDRDENYAAFDSAAPLPKDS